MSWDKKKAFTLFIMPSSAQYGYCCEEHHIQASHHSVTFPHIEVLKSTLFTDEVNGPSPEGEDTLSHAHS